MTFSMESPLLDFTTAGSRYSFSVDPDYCDSVRTVGASIAWENAQKQIKAITQLDKGWDGDGAPRIRADLTASAMRLLRTLRGKGYPAPNDVYPMPDGTVMVEWQFPDDVIMRIEVDGPGKGEKMVSYPDAPSVFDRISWGVGTWTTTIAILAEPVETYGRAVNPMATTGSRHKNHIIRGRNTPQYQMAA